VGFYRFTVTVRVTRASRVSRIGVRVWVSVSIRVSFSFSDRVGIRFPDTV